MDNNTNDSTGRVVIIIGGAGGAGHTVTRRWLESGASVLVAKRTQTALDGLRDSLHSALTERRATLATDVTTEAGANRMVAEATATFGRPADTLIHLVGGFTSGPLDASDAAQIFERMLALNLTAAFHCYRAMLSALRARGDGWIVGLGAQVATQSMHARQSPGDGDGTRPGMGDAGRHRRCDVLPLLGTCARGPRHDAGTLRQFLTT